MRTRRDSTWIDSEHPVSGILIHRWLWYVALVDLHYILDFGCRIQVHVSETSLHSFLNFYKYLIVWNENFRNLYMIIILLHFPGVVVILSGYCVRFEIILISVIVVFVNAIFIYVFMYAFRFNEQRKKYSEPTLMRCFFNGFHEVPFGAIKLWVGHFITQIVICTLVLWILSVVGRILIKQMIKLGLKITAWMLQRKTKPAVYLLIA